MRITMVSPFDPLPDPDHGHGASAVTGAHVGGVERVYAETAAALAARGHDVTILCSSPGTPRTGVTKDVHWSRRRRYATIMRVPVANLAGGLTKDSGIVQVPATYPLTTSSVLRRARRLGLPTILDFHFDPVPPGPIGKAAEALHRRFGTRAYQDADAVLVRSMTYAQASHGLREVPPSRWRVVPNGVDVTRFRPDGDARRDQGDYLLFVGRLVDYKGLDILFEALHRHPPGLPLKLVGDGPLKTPLRRLAKRLDIDVEFVGFAADHELPAYYRAARLTVLPSRNRQEAFGIALLESMACGTPVVASDLPGVAGLAQWGGLVARRGDPDALGLQIARACEPGVLPRGRRLAEPIHATFSWEAITDRLERVYEGVAAGRPDGTSPNPTTPRGRRRTEHAHPRRHAVL